MRLWANDKLAALMLRVGPSLESLTFLYNKDKYTSGDRKCSDAHIHHTVFHVRNSIGSLFYRPKCVLWMTFDLHSTPVLQQCLHV